MDKNLKAVGQVKYQLDAFVECWKKHDGKLDAVKLELGCDRATFFRKQKTAIEAGKLPSNATAKNSAGSASGVAVNVNASGDVKAPSLATAPAVAEVIAVVKTELPEKLESTSGGTTIYLADHTPKASEFEGYIPRANVLRQFEFIINQHKDGHQSGVPFLIGEAGTGKTSLARYVASVRGLPFLQIACDGLLEFSDLYGAQALVDGSTKFIEGKLIRLACNVPTIILLDEATFIDPTKFSRLLTFVENRSFFVKEANNGEGEVYHLHPETIIVLAGNPPTATYVGTGKVNLALVDRSTVVDIPTWTGAELKKIFKGKPLLDRLLKFYEACKSAIETQNLRTTFSIRDLNKIFSFLEAGFSLGDALNCGFLNGVKLTAGADKAKAFLGFATLHVGDPTYTVDEIKAGESKK